MRLRHRRVRPHSGPQRHLNPPYGAERRHGGRLHMKAEGKNANERRDRPKRRQVGGATQAQGQMPVQGQQWGQGQGGPGGGTPPTQAQMQQFKQMMQQRQQAGGTGGPQSGRPPWAGQSGTTGTPTTAAAKRGGRVRRRQSGGSTGSTSGSTSGMTPAQLEMLQQQQAMNASSPAAPAYNPTQVRRGGRVSHTNGRAEGGGKWIQKAIKHPGSLRRSLHVKEGEKIPAGKLAKAAHSSNPTLRRRAVLAETLRGLH